MRVAFLGIVERDGSERALEELRATGASVA
jgi:hypothetical protein